MTQLVTKYEQPDPKKLITANINFRFDKCENEAKLFKAAAHPNIIACYGLDLDTKNSLCVLMEYARHGDYPTFCKKNENQLSW